MGNRKTSLKNIGLIAAALVIGMAIPTFATSNSLGQQITVCVDWSTKQVTYSKFWEKCPPKTTPVQLGTVGPAGPQGEPGPQGPAGADGERGSRGSIGESGVAKYPWGSESSCYQQLQAALNAGYRMAFRADRQVFETDTGCLVEEIRDLDAVAKLRDLGLPVIENLEFVNLYDPGDWFGGDGPYLRARISSVYKIMLANYDSASGWLNFAGFCVIHFEDEFFTEWYPADYLGDSEYLITVPTTATRDGLITDVRLGHIMGGECEVPGWYEDYYLAVEIHEDPTDTLRRIEASGDPELNIGFPDLYDYWGW